MRRQQRRAHRRMGIDRPPSPRMLAAVAIGVLLWVSAPAGAQTWTPGQTTPQLRDIVTVDATGEDGWPYGSEDVAGDGANTFDVDEQRIDARTVYADATDQRTWVRTYLSATAAEVADTTAMYVFVDADDNPGTGSGADATDIDAEFTADPTSGGYDIAVGVLGDGTVVGFWTWTQMQGRWNRQNPAAADVSVERGLDLDPIRIGADTRSYLQVDVDHVLSGLDTNCNARIFVRLTDATLGYGDINAGGARQCVFVDSNNDGDPDFLDAPTTGCTSDADCPGDGVCLNDGTCVITYDCIDDTDCRADETCTNNTCVATSTGQCDSNADCDGLVCQASQCVPCGADSECASDEVCAPNGTCVTASQPTDTQQQGDLVDEVQGGACTCRVGTRTPFRLPAGAPVILILAASIGLRGSRGLRARRSSDSPTRGGRR